MSLTYRSIVPHVEILNKTVNGAPLVINSFAKFVSYSNRIVDGQPAGNFQIELIPKAADTIPGFSTSVNIPSIITRLVKTKDVISLGITKKHSFTGRIDAVSEVETFSRNNVSRRIIIAGRSFGSVLVDDISVFAPELAENPKALKLFDSQRLEFLAMLRGLNKQTGENIFINKHPFCAILWILYNMPAMNAPIKFIDYDSDGNINTNKKVKVGKYFLTKLIGHKKDLLFDVNLTQYANSSVYNYIMKCLDPMFYEVFVETVTEHPDTGVPLPQPRPCIFIRPKPYDRPNIEVKLKNMTDVRDFPFDSFKVSVTEAEQMSERIGNNRPGVSVAAKEIFFTEPDKDSLTKLDWGWNSLPVHTVHLEDLRASNKGQNIYDCVNYYYLRSTKDILGQTPLGTYGLLFPLIDGRSLEDMGLRPLIAETNLLIAATDKERGYDPSTTQIPQKRSNENYYVTSTGYVMRRNRMFHWNRINEILYGGMKTILGNEDVRLGHKAFCPEEVSFEGYQGIEYYVKGYTHQWSDQETFKSILETTRGMNMDEVVKFEKENGYYDFDNGIDSDLNKVIVSDIGIEPESENKSAGEKVNRESTDDQSSAGGLLSSSAVKYITGQFNKYKSLYAEQGVKSVDEIVRIIEKSAGNIGINPNVLAALIAHESAFDPYNKNPKSSATGLGQFLNSSAVSEGLTVAKNGGKYAIRGSENNPVPRSSILGYSKSDDRFNPKKVIPAICSHLQSKGWHRGASDGTLIKAIKKYGENTDAYYKRVLSFIKQFYPNTSLR